jgi:hypothetical protein
MALNPVSQERRNDPLAFFREILKSYFADNSWDDTMKLWRIALANGGSYPEDVLWCLDWIVEHPPENLAQLMYEDGWITLEHAANEDDETEERPYSFDEQVAWLRDRAAALKAEHDTARHSPRG